MNSFIGTFISVLFQPSRSMEGIKAQGQEASIKQAMIFVVIMGIISGIISTVWGFIVPPPQVTSGAVSKASLLLAIPLVPIVSFVLSFLGTFILWGLVHGLLKGSIAEYKTTYRIFALLAAFSPINSLLAPIPVAGQWLAIAINIWGIIILIKGVIIVFNTPVVRSWIFLGTIFILLFLMGLAFRNQAQQQFAAGPNFGAGEGAFGDDLGDGSALDKELEELANKAKEAEAPAK